MADNNEKLKPCPFCGNTHIAVNQSQTVPQVHFEVYCSNCGCGTMGVPSKDKAKRLWNTRTN